MMIHTGNLRVLCTCCARRIGTVWRRLDARMAVEVKPMKGLCIRHTLRLSIPSHYDQSVSRQISCSMGQRPLNAVEGGRAPPRPPGSTGFM
jgi:hypothetical protein